MKGAGYAGSGRLGKFVLAFVLLVGGACASGGGQSLPALEKEAHGALAQGDARTAMKLDRQALALSPGDPGLLNNLAVAEDRLGEEKKALRNLEEANRKSPRDPNILLNLARIDLKTGREGEAFRTASKIIPMDRWPEGFRTLMGKIDIDLSRYAEAPTLRAEASSSENSDLAMCPSDLYPISTTTSVGYMAMTVPSTTAPSSKFRSVSE